MSERKRKTPLQRLRAETVLNALLLVAAYDVDLGDIGAWPAETQSAVLDWALAAHAARVAPAGTVAAALAKVPRTPDVVAKLKKLTVQIRQPAAPPTPPKPSPGLALDRSTSQLEEAELAVFAKTTLAGRKFGLLQPLREFGEGREAAE